MDLFLHIGTEKTGTTSIQEFLYDNIDKFKEKNIHLSKLIEYPNNRHLAEMFTDYSIIKEDYNIPNKLFTAEDKKIFFTNLKKIFENEIEQTKLFSDKMIITSEHFHSQLKNIDQIKSLKNFLAKFFNKIKIICYFREQGDLAFSWYSTLIKMGSQIDIQTYLKTKVRIDNPYFNYYDFLKKWSDVFGKENIIPNIYDFKKKDNKYLIIDFLNKIDPKLIISEFKNTNLRKNIAIHPLIRKYFQLFNIANSKLQKQNIFKISFEESRKLINTAIINSSKNLPIYDPDYDQKMIIYEKFYESNVKFFTDFFYKKENLFKLPINQTVLSQQEILENEKKILLNFFSSMIEGQWVSKVSVEKRINNKLLKLKKIQRQLQTDKLPTKQFPEILSFDTKLSNKSIINTSKIYSFYEYIFKKKLELEIILENNFFNSKFVIISKDLNKLKIKLNIDLEYQISFLIAVIKICEFTKFFKNALFDLSDGATKYSNQKKISFCSNNFDDLLIPDFEFVLKYFPVLSKLEILPEVKSNLAVFCGAMNGLKTSKDRLNLFNFGINNNDILKLFLIKSSNVLKNLSEHKITYLEKFFPKDKDRDFFEIKNKIFKKIPLEKMYFFLVQVDVDGVTNSFPGFFHKLYSGRPLLKIRSSLGYRQWYYDRLTPDYHYFDVKSDLSNFREKYYQALEQSKTTKVFPGREFICKMNYDEELKLAADKISFYFK